MFLIYWGLFFDRESANFLVISSASMYTIMGKLLTELCGIAPSSEICYFPSRDWDYRQKNTRTPMLVSPLELLKCTRLTLYLYSIEFINRIENSAQAIFYRVFEFVLAL